MATLYLQNLSVVGVIANSPHISIRCPRQMVCLDRICTHGLGYAIDAMSRLERTMLLLTERCHHDIRGAYTITCTIVI